MEPHAPGPWEIDGKHENHKSPIIGDAYGQDVATVWTDADSDNEYPSTMAAANARLIAASPDMLAVLQSVACWLSMLDDPTENERETLDEVAEAITKATTTT